ncbi:MAG: regulatory protein SipA [Spirulinaceae cyanobacterium]
MSDINYLPGQTVRLLAQPQYFKTADPMPMLRPPDVVAVREQGILMERRPGNYWAVKFTRGIFLVDQSNLDLVQPDAE